MNSKLTIVVPMAGFGSRLRPHTWSKPKQLLEIAGKPLLGHILAMMDTLPRTLPREYVFITGWLGEQIQEYTAAAFPDLKIHFAEQHELLGQSHALYQAREYLHGPTLMVFADTLIETDLGFLPDESADAVAWTREVADPRRFGVAQTGPDGQVRRIIEKPQTFDNRQAVVGFYYFKQGKKLVDAIETQLVQDIQIRGEYYLADAVNLLIEDGLHMRIEPVSVWLDAGTPETTLETNAYLLEHGQANFRSESSLDGVSILPPVYIAPDATVENAVVGPHVSIGAGCTVRGSIVRNSILETGAELDGCEIHGSIVGRRVKLAGVKGIINVGDDSTLSSADE